MFLYWWAGVKDGKLAGRYFGIGDRSLRAFEYDRLLRYAAEGSFCQCFKEPHIATMVYADSVLFRPFYFEAFDCTMTQVTFGGTHVRLGI